MDTLLGWCEKTVFLIRRVNWPVLLLVTILIEVTYPLVALGTGNYDWMDPFLEGCSFFVPTGVLILWVADIGLLDKLFGPEHVTIIIVGAYYAIWVLQILLMAFALHNTRVWRAVCCIPVYILLCFDVVMNQIRNAHCAILVDFVLIVLFSLSMIRHRTRQKDRGRFSVLRDDYFPKAE